MSQQERIVEAIFTALDELNETLPKERRIPKMKEAVLYGPAGSIDSLGLTLLIVSLEQKIEQEFGTEVTLVSMTDDQSPFQTVQTLADHVARLLGKKVHG